MSLSIKLLRIPLLFIFQSEKMSINNQKIGVAARVVVVVVVVVVVLWVVLLFFICFCGGDCYRCS